MPESKQEKIQEICSPAPFKPGTGTVVHAYTPALLLCMFNLSANGVLLRLGTL